jgi:hypothetical protein
MTTHTAFAPCKFTRGTWVRFQRDGRFVIGQIEYVRRSITGWQEYVTDAGAVREDCVLEARGELQEEAVR